MEIMKKPVGNTFSGGLKPSGGISFCEYLLQRPQRGGERLCRDYSEFLRQPSLVHCANLIEQDHTLPATMIDTDPKRRASRPAVVMRATSTVRR